MLHSRRLRLAVASIGLLVPLLTSATISPTNTPQREELMAQSRDCEGYGRFIFYEGNSLRGDVLGSVWDCNSQFYKLKELNISGVPNDEARSVRLLGVRAGTRLVVYDSPGCSTDDDWAEVAVKTNVWDREVPSFTIPDYEDDEIVVVYHGVRNNGLDGKVSCIEVRVECHYYNLC
jgi:hypothetical protein